MAERFIRLFTLQETNLYETGAPLLLCAGALLKDTQTGKMIAQLKFRNISTKPIVAVKVSVRAFDAFGTEVEGVPEYQYLDLCEERDSEFGQKNAIILPNVETRSFSCACRSVIFSDGSAWTAQMDEWESLKKQKTLAEQFGMLAEQYRRDTFQTAQFAPETDHDLWRCACGAINNEKEFVCHNCKANREALFAAADPIKLKEHEKAHLRMLAEEAEAARLESERKAEEARIAAEITAKKRRKALMIILPVLAVMIVFALLLPTVILPGIQYGRAKKLFRSGQYTEAIEAFEKMDGYRDSEDQIAKCKIAIKDEQYSDAMGLFNSGKYEEAITAFETLNGYKDSTERSGEVKYAYAVELYNSGDYEKAIYFFESIEGYGNYKDESSEQIAKCKTAIINRDYEIALSHYNNANYEEALNILKTLDGYKDSLAMIDVCEMQIKENNYNAAVKLFNDGKYEEAIAAFTKLTGYKDTEERMKACQYGCAANLFKDNEYAEAAIRFGSLDDFSDAREKSFLCWDKVAVRATVSAGDWHMVGLKRDGTVVATGNNDDGQCNVSGWKDIVAVSAGGNHTVGLKRDGTVVATGKNDYGQCNVSGWKDIVAISAGTFITVGLKKDGTIIATTDIGKIEKIVAIEGEGSYDVLGLKIDGAVIFHGVYAGDVGRVCEWRDIAAISASWHHAVGLQKDGTVVATGWESQGQCNVSDWKDIVAVSAGSNHTVGLKKDGTVVATGWNKDGECNVSGWKDIVAITAGNWCTVGLKSDGTVVAIGCNYFGMCNVSDWKNIKVPGNN